MPIRRNFGQKKFVNEIFFFIYKIFFASKFRFLTIFLFPNFQDDKLSKLSPPRSTPYSGAVLSNLLSVVRSFFGESILCSFLGYKIQWKVFSFKNFFFTKISIFDENFDFWRKLRFLANLLKFSRFLGPTHKFENMVIFLSGNL